MSKRAFGDNQSRHRPGTRRRLQTTTFDILYRFGGRMYEPLTRFLFGGAWSRWRSSIIPYLPDGPVLDLGCGTGSFVNELNVKGYVAFGIEREPSMLRRTSSWCGARGRFVRGDAGALPFRTAILGACVATFPSRFVVQQTTLDEVTRVLRPGGTFAIVLSGCTEDWPLRRQPIRLALRLFYGPREAEKLPPTDFIAHPALTGDWHWLSNGPDHALVWLGQRAASEQAG